VGVDPQRERLVLVAEELRQLLDRHPASEHHAGVEPLFAERVAGLDIGKAGVEVTIRVPGTTAGRRRRQETRTFGTTRRELLDLAAWLACQEVAKAGMEATGDYWKPVFFLPRIAGAGLRALQRRSGQGAAGQAENRPGRLDLARQDHRARNDLLQLRAT
jgi:hypothetical protein